MRDSRATTGTSADPVEEPPAGNAVPAAATPGADPATGASGPAAAPVAGSGTEQTAPLAGARGSGQGPDLEAVGSNDRPDADAGQVRPSYTRAPGMPPPPDSLDAIDHGVGNPTTVAVPSSPVLSGPPRIDPASGSYPVVSASAPVSAPPRATGRVSAAATATLATAAPEAPDTAIGAVTLRPIGPGATAGAARAGQAVRTARTGGTTPRGPRRARLSVKRIDPWSVMKFSFAVSLVLFIVIIVAASVLYLALDSMGVFTSINETVADLVESGGGEGATFRITARGVIGTAAVLGALNVLLFTSLATLGAFIYNVCADLVGGVEVTLAERD